MDLLPHLEFLDDQRVGYNYGSGFLTGLLMSIDEPDYYEFFSDLANVYISMRNDLCICLVEDEPFDKVSEASALQVAEDKQVRSEVIE